MDLDMSNEVPYNHAATTRVLNLPDTFMNIMSHTEGNATRATAACVCKAWSTVALDCLWRDLDCVTPLLRLLIPPKFTQTSEDINAPCYSAADWNRFHVYARRVRSLTFDDDSGPNIIFINDAFADGKALQLAFFHPFGQSLLPEVRKVKWSSTKDDTALALLSFLSPKSLRQLDITLYRTVSDTTVLKLFRSLPYRTAGLQEFAFNTFCPAFVVNTEIEKLVMGSPDLRSITMPQFYHTVEIVRALGNLQGLKALRANYEFPNPPQDYGTHLALPEGSFPFLEELEFDTPSIVDATTLFARSSQVARLVLLSVSSQAFTTVVNLQAFITTLPTTCPVLVELTLNLFMNGEHTAAEAITFEHIRPLLAFRNMRSLSIGHDYPIGLDEAEVREMGREWPHLEQLFLCPDPSVETPGSGIPLSLLNTIAVELPNLTDLGLFFNAEDPAPYSGDLLPPHQLNSLRWIYPGLAQVPGGDPLTVGFFLGSLCPLGPKVTWGPSTWYLNAKTNARNADARWDTVDKTVKLTAMSKASVVKKMIGLRE